MEGEESVVMELEETQEEEHEVERQEVATPKVSE